VLENNERKTESTIFILCWTKMENKTQIIVFILCLKRMKTKHKTLFSFCASKE
jgi:hypothetical protein